MKFISWLVLFSIYYKNKNAKITTQSLSPESIEDHSLSLIWGPAWHFSKDLIKYCSNSETK